MYRLMYELEKLWMGVREILPYILGIMVVSRLTDIARELRILNEFIRRIQGGK